MNDFRLGEGKAKSRSGGSVLAMPFPLFKVWRIWMLTVVCMLLSLYLFATEEFRYKANLPEVDSAGFYAITLPPRLVSSLDYDFYDLRIYNQQKELVPYLWKQPKDQQPLLPAEMPRINSYDSIGHKESWFRIRFQATPYADCLTWVWHGPKYYHRQVRLVVPTGKRSRHGKKQFRTLQRFTLRSNAENHLDWNRFSRDDFYIVVENDDNQPLRLESAQAWQEPRSLIAYLETGEEYTLHYGNPRVKKPIFDLQHFRSEIPDVLPVLEPDLQNSRRMRWIGKGVGKLPLWAIWTTLMCIVIAVAFLTVRMIGKLEMNGGNEAVSEASDP